MRRFLSLLLATWLGVLIAEPVAVHDCAMHGAGGHGSHGAVAPRDEGHDDHAHHDHESSELEPTAGEQDRDRPDSGFCQCLGECCAASAAPLAQAAPRAAAENLLRHLLVTPPAPVPGARARLTSAFRLHTDLPGN